MEMSVKACLLGISLLLAAGTAASAPASQADLSAAANAAVQMNPTLAVPPGVTLSEVVRIYRPNLGSHKSVNWDYGGYLQEGWHIEGTLGFISFTPFENSAPIRECVSHTPWDNFSSIDVNCEGQPMLPAPKLRGYISQVQLAGTVPLYRCRHFWEGKQRHYDTLRADCDGNPAAISDGILGYVFM